MCGIAGIVNYQSTTEVLRQIAQEMVVAMDHRGPDANGLWHDNDTHSVLAHCRLAIQDLSPSGAQPMTSHSDRYVIAFNGEIYNFQKLRGELSVNTQFNGHSDTEVLLAAIEHWGLARTLTRIDGMFAFALFDRKERQLYLVRDRIGEKPLYYAVINQQLLFASELKAIFKACPARQFTHDAAALASYLRYGYINAPHSIFKEIRKLQPGHFIQIDLSDSTQANSSLAIEQIQQQMYWDVPSAIKQGHSDLITDAVTATDQLDTLLNTIIQEQSVADVPLGAFLSGGIDSSTVAAIVQANSQAPIDTFTIGFHDPSFNEAEHAKAVAAHIGSRHHEHYITGNDTLDLVPKMAQIYDEPFADSSQIPMFIVSQLARSKVTVCLSGDGGDELFAGYNRYTQTERMFQRLSGLPSGVNRLLSGLLTTMSPRVYDKTYQRLMRLTGRKGSANVGLKVHKLAGLMRQQNLQQAYQYLSSYSAAPTDLLLTDTDEPTFDNQIDFQQAFLSAAMEWDQRYYLPGDNLVKSDRASMANSLEMRLPLLDRKLIEFSWRIPNEFKLREQKSKWLLRQVLYRYVPEALIERPKMGFSIPIGQWLRSDLKPMVSELLSINYLEQQNIFDPHRIQKLVQQHDRNQFDHSNLLWSILMYQMWQKSYLG